MVLSILSVLTAVLVISVHSSGALEGRVSTLQIVKATVTTLSDRSNVPTVKDASNRFSAVNGCPATTPFFTVEAAIFPASQEEEVGAKGVGPVVQSCLNLGRKNPAKALRLCAQLAAVGYMVLLGTGKTNVAREISEKVKQTTRKQSTNNHKESTVSHGAVPRGEKASVQNILHWLADSFTQLLPFWAFSRGSTSEEYASSPAREQDLSNEAEVVESLWNIWKSGSTREADSSRSTAENSMFSWHKPVNLSTLFCSNLAEFHVEGNACGVAKFAKTSFSAAHVSHACPSTPASTDGSLAFADASVRPISPSSSCREETGAAVDLPLVSLQEYQKILSSSEESSGRVPAQVLQREGSTYLRLWEALDRLYQFHERMRCSSDGGQLPHLLPGWTPELLVDVTEPHHTYQNPLCVFARRDESLLIIIRGALTSAEWALTTEYELADFSPAYGKSIGKVSVGILKIYAAIWPALQTFLAVSTVQQGLKRVIVTGHSMGAAAGALISASLAASSVFDQDIDAVLFASPRPGDSRFMDFWEKRVNGRAVQFSLDVITELPCLQMPVCEGKKPAHSVLAALMGDTSQMQRFARAGDRSKDSSHVYKYKDYPNAIVFRPGDLPNAPDQQSVHIRYNHFCAYACWLGVRFDTFRKKTMCNKRTDAKSAAEDPSVCLNL